MAPLVLRKQNTLQMLHRFHETGDEALIETVIRSQQQRVYAMCLRELRHEADAQDAAQTVLMRLVQHAGRIETDLDAWLSRTCKNTCISLIRSAAARRKREATTACENREMLPIDPDNLSETEARAILDRCLAHLDESDAKLLHHRFIHGTSQSDLAEMFGISQQAVSKRIRRVLTNLRGEMKQRGVFGLLGGTLVITTLKYALFQSKQAMAAVIPSTAGSIVGTSSATAGIGTGIKVAAGVAVASAAGVGLKVAKPPSPISNTPINKIDDLAALAQPLTEPIKYTLLHQSATNHTAQQLAQNPILKHSPIQQLAGHSVTSDVPTIGSGLNRSYSRDMTLVVGGKAAQVPRPPKQLVATSVWSQTQTDTHIGWRASSVPTQIVGSVSSLTPAESVLVDTTDLAVLAAPSDSEDEPKSLIESAQEAVFRILGPGIPDLFPDVSLPSLEDLAPSVPDTFFDLFSNRSDAGNGGSPISFSSSNVQSSTQQVPEPVTSSLLAMLTIGGLLRRRRR